MNPLISEGVSPVIPDNKISNYLLDKQHKEGGSKAKYLERKGITEPDVLRDILLRIWQEGKHISTEQTEHGTKHRLQLTISLEHDVHLTLLTVWIITNANAKQANFVTAYPIHL